MSKYIIDLQGFSHNQSYIVKELTVIDLYSQNVSHFLVKPPFDKSILSDGEQKSVSWLENYHHKIAWEDGMFDYDEVFADLRKIIRDADIIYVKGCEKTLFIRKITGKFTVDLDKLDCPGACMLPIPQLWRTVGCNYHNHSNYDGVCSLFQAMKFREWLLDLFQGGHDEVDL